MRKKVSEEESENEGKEGSENERDDWVGATSYLDKHAKITGS